MLNQTSLHQHHTAGTVAATTTSTSSPNCATSSAASSSRVPTPTPATVASAPRTSDSAVSSSPQSQRASASHESTASNDGEWPPAARRRNTRWRMASSRQSQDSTVSQGETRINRRDGQAAKPLNGRIRRFSDIRGSENLHSTTFTTVEMNLDIFLGGCSFETTEQHIIHHVTSKGIRGINCVPIEANVRWYKPIKITVSPNDRDKLLAPSPGPVHTFVRKFHNVQSRNSRRINNT